ncbi:hypothetical protein GA0070624_5151 [Micromonospora rhizosphaerae]|uniref:Uncharacterized protein n=1 Tax=Micromonospora rhizosphaerae TaxID=568872 RepID=A0A1C6SZP4_9ACTN|nr:hypothetical protein GA0070624_5151 [Micromonospora rhizosphaerae]
MSQLTDRLADFVGRYVQAVIVVHHSTFMNSHEGAPQALECFLFRGHGLHSLDPSPSGPGINGMDLVREPARSSGP